MQIAPYSTFHEFECGLICVLPRLFLFFGVFFCVCVCLSVCLYVCLSVSRSVGLFGLFVCFCVCFLVGFLFFACF